MKISNPSIAALFKKEGGRSLKGIFERKENATCTCSNYEKHP